MMFPWYKKMTSSVYNLESFLLMLLSSVEKLKWLKVQEQAQIKFSTLEKEKEYNLEQLFMMLKAVWF